MENSKLLVPVVLSIMNNYKEQVAKITMELKEIELILSKIDTSSASQKAHCELVNKAQVLKSDLAEKEVLVQGFSDIYETRKWAFANLVNTDIVLH